MKTKTEMLAACRDAINVYDLSSNKFYNKPGKAGRDRRTAFLKLIDELESGPACADDVVVKIYQFYNQQTTTSRLAKSIFNVLAYSFEISIPPIIGISEIDHKNHLAVKKCIQDQFNLIDKMDGEPKSSKTFRLQTLATSIT